MPDLDPYRQAAAWTIVHIDLSVRLGQPRPPSAHATRTAVTAAGVGPAKSLSVIGLLARRRPDRLGAT
jgi:hypothetical protein